MQPDPSGNARFNLSLIIAACILAAGMVSAARINAGRPAAPPPVTSLPQSPATETSTTAAAVRPLTAPPFSQEAVQEQVRAQIRASPDLQTYQYNKALYRVSDVTVSDVSYSAKDDTFLFRVNWTLLPTFPATPLGSSTATYVSLNNNGYNQYVGDVVMNMGLDPGYVGKLQSATVRVK